MNKNEKGINILPLLQESAVKNKSGVVITGETNLGSLVTLQPSQKATLPLADIVHLSQGGNLVIDIGGNVIRQKSSNGNGKS